MPKSLIRFIAFLLVSCLAADPGTASAIAACSSPRGFHSRLSSGIQNPTSDIFQQEAVNFSLHWARELIYSSRQAFQDRTAAEKLRLVTGVAFTAALAGVLLKFKAVFAVAIVWVRVTIGLSAPLLGLADGSWIIAPFVCPSVVVAAFLISTWLWFHPNGFGRFNAWAGFFSGTSPLSFGNWFAQSNGQKSGQKNSRDQAREQYLQLRSEGRWVESTRVALEHLLINEIPQPRGWILDDLERVDPALVEACKILRSKGIWTHNSGASSSNILFGYAHIEIQGDDFLSPENDHIAKGLIKSGKLIDNGGELQLRIPVDNQTSVKTVHDQACEIAQLFRPQNLEHLRDTSVYPLYSKFINFEKQPRVEADARAAWPPLTKRLVEAGYLKYDGMKFFPTDQMELPNPMEAERKTVILSLDSGFYYMDLIYAADETVHRYRWFIRSIEEGTAREIFDIYGYFERAEARSSEYEPQIDGIVKTDLTLHHYFRDFLRELIQEYGMPFEGLKAIELGPRKRAELLECLRTLGVDMEGVGDEVEDRPYLHQVSDYALYLQNMKADSIDFFLARFSYYLDREKNPYQIMKEHRAQTIQGMFEPVVRALKENGIFITAMRKKEWDKKTANGDFQYHPTPEEAKTIGLQIVREYTATLMFDDHEFEIPGTGGYGVKRPWPKESVITVYRKVSEHSETAKGFIPNFDLWGILRWMDRRWPMLTEGRRERVQILLEEVKYAGPALLASALLLVLLPLLLPTLPFVSIVFLASSPMALAAWWMAKRFAQEHVDRAKSDTEKAFQKSKTHQRHKLRAWATLFSWAAFVGLALFHGPQADLGWIALGVFDAVLAALAAATGYHVFNNFVLAEKFPWAFSKGVIPESTDKKEPAITPAEAETALHYLYSLLKEYIVETSDPVILERGKRRRGVFIRNSQEQWFVSRLPNWPIKEAKRLARRQNPDLLYMTDWLQGNPTLFKEAGLTNLSYEQLQRHTLWRLMFMRRYYHQLFHPFLTTHYGRMEPIEFIFWIWEFLLPLAIFLRSERAKGGPVDSPMYGVEYFAILNRVLPNGGQILERIMDLMDAHLYMRPPVFHPSPSPTAAPPTPPPVDQPVEQIPQAIPGPLRIAEKGLIVHVSDIGIATEHFYRRGRPLMPDKGSNDRNQRILVKINEKGQPIGRVKEGDSLILFNIRQDRQIQLAKAIVAKDSPAHPRLITMIPYPSADLQPPKIQGILVDDEPVADTIVETAFALGFSQVSITNPEKGHHLWTFLMGGVRMVPFLGHFLEAVVPRKNSGHSKLDAQRIVDVVLEVLRTRRYKTRYSADPDKPGVGVGTTRRIDPNRNLIYINFPNMDVRGHENLVSAIRGVKEVDDALRQTVPALRRAGYWCIMTADHGSVERMLNEDRKTPATDHSTNPVNFTVIYPEYLDAHFSKPENAIRLKKDIANRQFAPTLFKLMGLEKERPKIWDADAIEDSVILPEVGCLTWDMIQLEFHYSLQTYGWVIGILKSVVHLYQRWCAPKRGSLIVTDGRGINPVKEDPGDATQGPQSDYFNSLLERFPNEVAQASGGAVGLREKSHQHPGEPMPGTSEAGHLNIGAGHIVIGTIVKVDHMIDPEGAFKDEAVPLLLAEFEHVKTHGTDLHLGGQTAEGELHSSLAHLFAFMRSAARHGVPRVYIHSWTDGVDTPEYSFGDKWLPRIQATIAELAARYPNTHIELVTTGGRDYTSDRGSPVYAQMTRDAMILGLDSQSEEGRGAHPNLFLHERESDGQAKGDRTISRIPVRKTLGDKLETTLIGIGYFLIGANIIQGIIATVISAMALLIARDMQVTHLALFILKYFWIVMPNLIVLASLGFAGNAEKLRQWSENSGRSKLLKVLLKIVAVALISLTAKDMAVGVRDSENWQWFIDPLAVLSAISMAWRSLTRPIYPIVARGA